MPPGVPELPAPGELVVSAALARLLASSDGELLRPRLDRVPGAGPGGTHAIEHAHNTRAGIDKLLDVHQAFELVAGYRQFSVIRRGLLAGVTATLLLIGSSLLVSTVEQVRERRRLLAVLVAFGTRRRTLGWSVLWQTAIPVVLGLLLAIVAGTGLGAILLAMGSYPPTVDAPNIAAVTGIAAAVVLLVTGLTMPALWRMMRPGGLRTE